MSWNLARVRLQLPKTQETPIFNPLSSLLLSCPLICNSLNTIMLLHPSVKKDSSIGRLFSNIRPDSNSKFILEVAAELPDRLPNVENKTEYLVNVTDKESNLRTLCVSNQIVRGDFLQDGEQKLIILPSYLVEKLATEDFSINISPDISYRSLRTMVSSKYPIEGYDAEELLEENVAQIVDSFLFCVNQLMKAYQMLSSGEEYPALPSGYNRSSLDYLYIALYGESIHKNGFDRISLNFGKVNLTHNSISENEFLEVCSYLSMEKDYNDTHLLLVSAKNSLDSGMEELSLLQMVLVGQMAANKFVKARAKAHGISNRRLRQYGNRIPYGQTLNILLPSLCTKRQVPDSELLNTLNEAKDKRNDLIHDGEMKATTEELYKYYAATRDFVSHLSAIEEEAAETSSNIQEDICPKENERNGDCEQ